MGCVAESKGGQVAFGTAEHLLDMAHTLVDTYVPPAKGNLHETEGRGGSLGLKAVALTNKIHRRFKRHIHTQLNVNSKDDLDDDDVIITSGHLLELGRRSLFSWYLYISQQQHVQQVMEGANAVRKLVLNGAKTLYTAMIHRAGTVCAFLTRDVESVERSGRVGSIKGGFKKSSDVGRDALDMLNKESSSVALACTLVTNRINVAHRVMKCGLDVVYTLTVRVTEKMYSGITEAASMAHTVLSGTGIVHNIMNARIIGCTVPKSTTKHTNIVRPTIIRFPISEYACMSSVAAQLKKDKATTQAALWYSWGVSRGMMAWVASVIHSYMTDNSSDLKVRLFVT